MKNMETLPVTLIVKAPNQQIEDQTIKCELSWTINKLKQHLQEVYPSKPPKHEQKLIYSGQLLSDSLMLRDVLRQYDGQQTHTVHLVCSSKHNPPPKPTTSKQERRTMPEAATSTTATDLPPQSNTAADPQFAANAPWLLNGGVVDPNYYAMHMAWMQQAYMQYRTQQYLNFASNVPGVPPNFQFPQQQAQQTGATEPNQRVQAEGAEDVDGGQQVPAAAAPRDPDNVERDWLDLFYLLSRVIVLFSIVYFYSSPLRFILVLVLGFALYLYQIGFFRNINVNNNNINFTGGEPGPEHVEAAPSRLMVVWTFLATFFASLIPEIPNAI